MRRRVVVTGLGTVNPVGNDIPSFWQGLCEGTSGIGPITRFDASGFPATIAGEVKEFDPRDYMDRRDARKMDVFSHYAVASALQAMKDAGLYDGDYDKDRTGVVLGVGIGGFESLEVSYETMFTKQFDRIPPMTIPKLISNIGPGNVAIALDARGPAYAVATACASATDAIGNAYRWIQEGRGEVMIAGGVEACITRMGVMGFCVIKALSTSYNDRPTEASRPFDKDRDGFVIGEGAGVLVLEDLEHAVARGARIYAEVAGSGMTCDATHLTAPHPEGRGAIAAMRMALDDAGMQPEAIDYINAHGTSTPINDPTETAAIKAAFGDHAYALKVSSTKSMTGHCIGAAGGIEAIAGILALRDQFFPPTINLHEPGEGCDLDYVPNTGVSGEINAVMSNSLGFGGHNGVIIFKKHE
jgi:3-oxoacyl-[acyl-carrier-protein] synthase II